MPEVTPKLAKQHPVPQHIAAFEFKLVGDLTLRQFLYAGVGLAVAYAAYISNLDFLVKWTIVILSGGLGLGLAFFPIQDRGLDTWIVNFILSMTSPTQEIWRKEPLPPEYFREDYGNFLASQVLSVTPPEKRRKLAEYLKTSKKDSSQLELYEQEFLDRLNFGFPVQEAAPQPPPKPTPLPEPVSPPPSLAEKLSIERAKAELEKLEGLKKEFYAKNEAYRTRLLEQEGLLKRLERKKDFFPGGGENPNTIRGTVQNSQGNLLPEVIVIVKDQDGDPVRALKSGETGQFFSTTPLENGRYTVEGSYKGKRFAIINLELTGQILAPIELKERYRA